MNIGVDDIDIFVLTYNRPRYLSATLDSILSQSLGVPRVTVLDNASSDDTARVLARYNARGVRSVISPQNLGWRGNLARAQHLAERQWVMAFHDDDLMHPKYLEVFAKAVTERPDIVLAASGMSFENAPNGERWPDLGSLPPISCPTASDFARQLYRGFPVHFGSAIYRTSVFRSLQWEEQYGKIADRPFLLDAAQQGRSIIFSEPFIRYRVHEGQDSGATDTGPFVAQLCALHACYASLLGTSVWSRNGRTFLSRFVTQLHSEYSRLAIPDRLANPKPSAYVAAAAQVAGVRPSALTISWLYRMLVSLPLQNVKRALGR